MKTMNWRVGRCLTALLVTFTCGATTMQSQADTLTTQSDLFYAFHESRTDDVLAFLHLETLPADQFDIISLEFTLAGEAYFGYSGLYTGFFDIAFPSTGEIIDDGQGGLRSNGTMTQIIDVNPPPSPLDIHQFGLIFHTGGDRLVADSGIPDSSDGDIIVDGIWLARSVPEPSSLLPTLTVLSMFFNRRRSKTALESN